MASHPLTRSSHSKSRVSSTIAAASGSPGAISKPLRRGQACINCRQLKIKCDGVKPVCGSCVRNPRPDPCEYTDDLANSRTRALEEEVAQLKSLIWELKHPGQRQHEGSSSSEVLLHDPYHPLSSPSSLLLAPEHFHQESTTSSSQGTPPIVAPQIGQQRSRSDADSSPRSRGGSPAQLPSQSDNTSLSLEKRNVLLQAFLANSHNVGFFLDTTRYHSTVSSPSPQPISSSPYSSPAVTTRPRRFTAPLLACIFLWGAHITQFSAESAFLEQALKLSATWALSHLTSPVTSLASPSQKLVEILQTHVLLANYLIRTDRLALARVQTSAATSLCFHHNLHRLRSSSDPRNQVSGLGEVGQEELDELITAFWAVFALGKMMAVSLDPPNSLCGAFEAPGVQVDTPWPVAIDAYGTGSSIPNPGNTIRNLLNDVPTGAVYDSKNALYTKAVVLYHRAAYLAGQWHPSLNARDSQSFYKAFQTLDNILESFKTNHLSSLFPIDEPSILTHTLLHAATIVLHYPFFQQEPWSNNRCLLAAGAVVNLASQLTLDQRSVCDNTFATLWKDACLVFIQDIGRVRTLRSSWTLQPEFHGSVHPEDLAREESESSETLNRLMRSMSLLEPGNALMRMHLAHVRRSYRLI